MQQYVLDDPILSNFSSCHIGPVLQLSQQSHLRGLMAHHWWQSSDFSWLIFLNQGFYLFRSQLFLRFFDLLFNFTFAQLIPLTNLGLILIVVYVPSSLTIHIYSRHRLHIQIVNIVLAVSFLRNIVQFNARSENAISFNRTSLVLKCLFG